MKVSPQHLQQAGGKIMSLTLGQTTKTKRLSMHEKLAMEFHERKLMAVGGQTPLFVASGAGRLDCTRALLNAGADRSRSTTDSCTALHAAVSSGHVDTLRLLLCHPPPDHTHHDPNPDHNHSPGPAMVPILSSTLLNQANCEGWTAAHIAAARGFKVLGHDCCTDIERRDKWNRTIHDVATDDCKDLLENLYSYRVLVCVQSSGSGEPMCPVEVLKDGVCVSVLGGVCIHRATRWAELNHALGQALTSHLQLLCGNTNTHTHTHQHTNQPTRDDTLQHTHLGLTPASMASVLIGDTVWLPGQELSLSPWDLVRKPLSQHITIRLKGLSESCLDELALESLIPLQLLQNYVRLVEQYRNIIFHGLEGSCQEYLANQISRCIKTKQEVVGVACDIIRVEVDRSLTKQQLLDTFITCGFLVPVGGVSVCSGSSSVGRLVVLEGLEKANSLTELLGDLCEGLENRGKAYLLHGQMGPHHFQEGGFLIGTLSKSRLKGSELRLQQHFRWVTLRWDSEPLHGLLGRHLCRKLLHKTQAGGSGQSPEGLLERTVCWQLNACLSRHEALLGPQLFLSCPVVPHNTQAIVKWLARLWNMVVVPRVEESIVTRVTVKRSSGQQASSSNLRLSSGQQAVVKAALSILLNKAIDRHLLEFQGGTFPLSAIGSCKGSGGRKGRDSGMWRRANTSPRKKGSPTSNWSCGGSLREGSLSNTDVRFITNGNALSVVDGDPVSLSLCSDDETDLIRELQTSCAPASQSQTSARLLSPRRTSLSSLALQVDNRPAGRPTVKQPLDHDHRRPAAVTPLPAPPQAAPPLAMRGDQLPVPNLSSPSPAAGDRSHEPTAAVLRHEHPPRPLTATPAELNQAAAKQGRPQQDITTTSTKTTNNTRTFGSYTETCMKQQQYQVVDELPFSSLPPFPSSFLPTTPLLCPSML
ncbi:unnamed protein product [Coregonus sp. 'balchen']|nr:unnamed protein product [Coregonus sp. 'balchen']